MMMNSNDVSIRRDYSWIENLALEELNMEQSGFINFHENYHIEKILEQSGIEFIQKIKDRFDFYVGLFNQYRSSREMNGAVKTFRISNTINDFMLFRNSLKLVVSKKSPDTITIGFLNNSSTANFSGYSEMPENNLPVHELKAHVGPFNQVTWRFKGEVVDVEAVVKFYLSEFIRASAR